MSGRERFGPGVAVAGMDISDEQAWAGRARHPTPTRLRVQGEVRQEATLRHDLAGAGNSPTATAPIVRCAA
jgi:hypothetical protein